MRAFLSIGAAVALFWGGVFFLFYQRNANLGTSPDVACRTEQILLAVSRNQGVIGEIKERGRDLVVDVNSRYWLTINNKQKNDIGMAAWCVQSHRDRSGVVIFESGADGVDMIENGAWVELHGDWVGVKRD